MSADPVAPRTVVFSVPNPTAGHYWSMPPPETPKHSGKSGSVSCGITAPFSWVLCIQSCLCPRRVFPQSCASSVMKSLASKSNSLGVFSPFARSPSWKICWAKVCHHIINRYLLCSRMVKWWLSLYYEGYIYASVGWLCGCPPFTSIFWTCKIHKDIATCL